MTRVCTKCRVEKSLDNFYRDKSIKLDGRQAQCKHCKNEYYKVWQQSNPDKIAKIGKRYRDKNLDKERNRAKRYARLNPNKIRLKNKIYRTNNQSQYNFYESVRRAKKKDARPDWVDMDQLQAIYDNCPSGYQVDHIVPLQHSDVSGLHVPWNLQYLTTKQNQQKSNKLLNDE